MSTASMTEIPWKGILIGLVGVPVMARAISEIYRWAIRSDPGGPFSGVLSVVGTTGPVPLAILGGSLLIIAGWLLDLGSSNEF
jgi:hypothetical protein